MEMNKFDERLKNAPWQWSEPLSEVIDTYESILLGLAQFGHENQANVAVELTKLVLSRHDAIVRNLPGNQE